MICQRIRNTELNALRAAASLALCAGLCIGVAGCNNDDDIDNVDDVSDAGYYDDNDDVAADNDRIRDSVYATPSSDPDLDGRAPRQARDGESGAHVRGGGFAVQRDTGGDGGVLITAPGANGEDTLEIRRMQPDRVLAGQSMDYSIKVLNVGDTVITNIAIEEWHGGAFTLENASISGEGRGDQRGRADSEGSHENANRYTIDALRPGEERVIDVTGSAKDEGQIRTCMTIDYEPAICFVTEVVKPDLRLERRVESDFAYVCDDVEVTYIVTNTGSGAARNVQLREELPQGAMFAESGRRYTQTIDRIDPGESVEFIAVFQAESAGEFSSRAVIGEGDSLTRSSSQGVYFARPELSLTVDAPRREYVGRSVTLDMSVTNTSDVPALRTVLNVAGLSELPQVSLSSQRAQLEGDSIVIGELGPGETRNFALTYDADNTRTNEITVLAEAYCARTVEQTIATEILGIEAVRLEVIDLVDPVMVGEETIYEIRVKNQGSAESVNVMITALLPDEMTFVGGEGDSAVRGEGQTINIEAIPRLMPGDIATWRVTALAERPGKTRLKLELQTDATERPVISQEPTTVVGQ